MAPLDAKVVTALLQFQDSTMTSLYLQRPGNDVTVHSCASLSACVPLLSFSLLAVQNCKWHKAGQGSQSSLITIIPSMLPVFVVSTYRGLWGYMVVVLSSVCVVEHLQAGYNLIFCDSQLWFSSIPPHNSSSSWGKMFLLYMVSATKPVISLRLLSICYAT